jgi:ceramide glucosyltransferase
VPEFLLILVGLLLAGALAYSFLSVIAALRYLAVPVPPAATHPEAVSVLKPLSGLDEGLEANLRSFFEQDYPDFEILFAVRQESDPCVPLVRRLCAEYSGVPSRLILVGEPPYPHAKVYSLARMLTEARHDLVVMSDSDIRVDAHLLRAVAAEFAAKDVEDGQVALATCPYRAVAGRSFWSQLEATGMNTTFWQGVRSALPSWRAARPSTPSAASSA